MKVTNWPFKCGYLLIFGLGLYVLDVGLHVGLAVKYLTMTECYRGVSHTFTNFKLNDLLDLEQLPSFSSDISDLESSEIQASGLSSKLSEFLGGNLYLNLRQKLIRILPQHWIDRIVNIITFQAGKYKGSDIAKMCKLNGNQFNSLAEMAVYVCDKAFQSTIKEEEASRAARALTSILDGELILKIVIGGRCPSLYRGIEQAERVRMQSRIWGYFLASQWVIFKVKIDMWIFSTILYLGLCGV